MRVPRNSAKGARRRRLKRQHEQEHSAEPMASCRAYLKAFRGLYLTGAGTGDGLESYVRGDCWATSIVISDFGVNGMTTS